MYYIIVKTQFEAFHRYVDAPEAVSFLRSFHRHVFHVEVKISVDHSNRSEEFFIVKSKIDAYLQEKYMGEKFEESCEQIAENLFNFLEKACELKVLQVEVQEDNENIGGYYV